jgi:coenzyme F420-reducing hydrogenase delta subunit
MHDTAGSGIIGCDMAQHGEWSRKGATLSHVTARKEYGVDEDFIVTGINAGKLEYREGAVHGNPYIRVLRRQLEAYINEELGDEYLHSWQAKTELRDITREMAELRKRLDELEARRAQIEGRD